MSTRYQPFVFVLLVLAAIGFMHALVAEPYQLLLIIGMSALLYFFVNQYLKTGRFWPTGKPGAPTRKRTPKTSRPPAKKAPSSRKRFPFQVIEGNKGKSKSSEQEQRLP